MAQRVEVSLVDDLDGGVAAETLQFMLDGKNYEIDLSEKHAKSLRDGLSRYVAAARRPGGRAGRAASRGQSSSSEERERNQAIRDWARSQNMKVSDRGRIPSDVIAAYDKAN